MAKANVCRQNTTRAFALATLTHASLAGLQRGPGHQSQAEIQSLLAQAMAARRDDDASLGDDIIRRPEHRSGGGIEEEVLYQVRFCGISALKRSARAAAPSCCCCSARVHCF